MDSLLTLQLAEKEKKNQKIKLTYKGIYKHQIDRV